MKVYNGLSRNQVIEIHSFVMKKRKDLGYGQTRIYRLVKEKFGVEIKENTLSGWIFRGIKPFGNEKTQFKPKPRPQKEELYELYINQKQSSEKIAKKYDVSTIIVINWLKSYKIPTRNHLESMRTLDVRRQLREIKLRRPTKKYNELIPEKAYILGVLCGDACLYKKTIKLEIRRDEDFIDEFVRCFEKVYGLEYNYKYYKPKNTFVAQINSEIISQDIIKYGNFKTRSWEVPKEIIESKNEKIIGSYLKGFYDSEGSVSRCAITSSSINKDGLRNIALLLKKLGIETTLKSYGNGKYCVLYIFRKGRFKIFRERVGFTIKRKLNKIDETLNTGFFSKRSIAN
ncbi:hypothetical protein HYV49_02135 [Candidatus Pacearchaeota archaeon]|nr:hypothetical protein [Candidatus Pacearchaeota archaeon]